MRRLPRLRCEPSQRPHPLRPRGEPDQPGEDGSATRPEPTPAGRRRSRSCCTGCATSAESRQRTHRTCTPPTLLWAALHGCASLQHTPPPSPGHATRRPPRSHNTGGRSRRARHVLKHRPTQVSRRPALTGAGMGRSPPQLQLVTVHHTLLDHQCHPLGGADVAGRVVRQQHQVGQLADLQCADLVQQVDVFGCVPSRS